MHTIARRYLIIATRAYLLEHTMQLKSRAYI